ncbi:MAG: NAD(P)-binding domain-containing protein [Hyphomicrobiaceae bacterium]
MAQRRTAVIVIGAGHAGLAMSRCLDRRGIDHVVLERGKVANSWRTERWDSLRLLTPNWCSRLPDFAYSGKDPDGFMNMGEIVAFIDAYASQFTAPVETGTTVISVRADDDGYRIVTNRDTWRCTSVVIATGACNIPRLPKLATDIPTNIAAVHAMDYRRPAQLPDGPALVVGSSATGIQLAQEIHRSGRPVTLSVGEHIRMPRVYRDKDILWWMDACGLQDERHDEINDIVRGRELPSLQLTGSDMRETLDLNSLASEGVRFVGRLAAIRANTALFSGSLRNQCALSDLKMNRLLNTIDEWAINAGLDAQVPAAHRFPPTQVPDKAPLSIDLAAEGIQSIVWATGYRPDYSWLEVDVFDSKGRIRHDGGIVDKAGLYLMGLQFLRRRKSSLIDGAADDALELSAHLAVYLDA